MKLGPYLKKHAITHQQFADRLGVSRGLVTQWVLGDTIPIAERCLQIERETNGAVRVESLNPDVPWFVITRRRKTPLVPGRKADVNVSAS